MYVARFIQADTLVPGAGNPLRYMDPSSHRPLLVTAFVGAGLDAGVNIGVQVISIMGANQGAISLGQAMQQAAWDKLRARLLLAA